MERPDGPVGGIGKRSFDCVAALTVLAIMFPIMLMTAILILVIMGRPIFTAERSIGFNKSLFGCLTFRTAIPTPHDASRAIEAHLDTAVPRVTQLGNILRESGLDRLPQLFNILCGHMSFIGPQRLPASELTCRGPHMRDYLKARPGLVGLWQLDLPQNSIHSNRIASDCYYVQRWSPSLDVFILLRTALSICRPQETASNALHANAQIKNNSDDL